MQLLSGRHVHTGQGSMLQGSTAGQTPVQHRAALRPAPRLLRGPTVTWPFWEYAKGAGSHAH